MILQRYLFVGLGGSGLMTLRFLDQYLRSALAARGVHELPAAWQMLAVDVKTTQDDVPGHDRLVGTRAVPNFMPLTEDPRVRWDSVRGSARLADQGPAIDSWSPWVGEARNVPLGDGAGQYRAIGRTMTLLKMGDLRKRLTDLVPKESDVELAELTQTLGFEIGPNDVPQTLAVVIASIAGGSGAGMVLDVCDLLMSHDDLNEKVVACLYAPEVFSTLQPTVRSGVNGNALAVASELMARSWATEHQGGDQALFETAGSPLGDVVRGPKFTLLVGRTNTAGREPGGSGAHFVNHYEAMASAMSSWVTNPATFDQWNHYFIGNPASRTSVNNTKLRGDSEANDQTKQEPFSAIGFASLSMGNRHAVEWAAERLAKKALDKLLGGGAPEEVEKLAESNFDAFIKRARFNERLDGDTSKDPEDDQVLNDLRSGADPSAGVGGGDRPTGWRESTARVRAEVAQWKHEWRRSEHDAPAWVGAFRSRLGTVIPRFRVTESAKYREHAEVWFNRAQERLVATVEEYAASVGLRATSRLLHMLSDELGRSAEALRSEASKFDSDVTETMAAVGRSVIASLGTRLLNGGGDALDDFYKESGAGLQKAAESELRRLAADMLEDARSSLVLPLREVVDRGFEQLDYERRNDSRKSTPVHFGDWVTNATVPARLRPGPTTLLLHAVNDAEFGFQARLKAMLEVQFGGDRSFDDALGRAASEAVRGLVTETQREQVRVSGDAPVRGSLIDPDTAVHWRPIPGPLPDREQPRRAQFSAELTALLVRHRAEEWITRLPEVAEAVLQPTLFAFLDGQPTRMKLFLERFEQMLDMAAPLVQISPVGLHEVHGEQKAKQAGWLSALPFGADSGGDFKDLYASMIRLLKDEEAARGISTELAESRRVSEITATTFLFPPVNLAAVRSLTEPIMEQVNQLKVQQNWPAFWQWKRPSRLDGFVAAPTPVRRQLVRGYFVAELFGLFLSKNEMSGVVKARRVEILDPNTGKPAGFPFPLLTATPSAKNKEVLHWQLAALLESLVLAIVTAGASGAQAAKAALLPYQVLLELGKWAGTSGGEGDLSLPSRVLAGKGFNAAELRWLEAKKSPALEDFAATRSPEERIGLAVAWLEGELAKFTALGPPGAAWRRGSTGVGADELYDDIINALDGLIDDTPKARPEDFGR